MQKFIDASIKPVLIVGGLGTALASVNAFFPRFAVENVQGIAWVQDYTIFVQHWGIMVGLFGVFMVAAAFIESWRVPILLYGLLEKAFMVYLVTANAGLAYAEGFYVPAMMDAFLTVYSILYFVRGGRHLREIPFGPSVAPWIFLRFPGEFPEVGGL